MSRTMHLEVVSNEEQLYSDQASFIVVPTLLGELGIYPGHTPIMSLLKPGVLRIQSQDGKNEQLLAISGGLLEVRQDSVIVLSDVAIRSQALDRERANLAKKNAEERLRNAGDSHQAKVNVEAALAAAIAQLKALEYIKLHQKN